MRRLALLLLSTLLTARASAKGCTAVPLDKCGTDWYDSCLKCGNSSTFDCEKCCPGCTLASKSGFSYCTCSGPKPFPPGGDSWDRYTVAGMDVISVVGGSDKTAYDRVVIMLHGGGGSGSDWYYQYSSGWFGNLTGIKYVFPTSARSGHTWYQDYKIPGCGLLNDCAYNLSSIRESAGRVAALIEHEKQKGFQVQSSLGSSIPNNNVFLAGFSEGAQLTGYVQLCQLEFALGGAIVMDGFPLPPLENMPGADPASAKKNATYYGNDMRWMIWEGADDPIFPAKLTMNTWDGIFVALGASSTVKIKHVEPGMTHTLVQKEFEQLVQFVRSD